FILTPADQGKIDQEFLRSLADGLHQYNLGKRPAHILSEYRDRCVFLRFDNLIPADDFALRHEYAKAYQTAIQNPRDAVNARLLHIFPAEINAVEIETTRWKQTGQIRLLHPSVVTLLEDRTKANLFALSLAYRFITLNTDDQGRVWFELANEAIYLTEPVQIRTDPVSLLPAAMYQFVIAGEDARPQRGQPIDYDRIHNAVWTIQREMDSQEAIDQLQQQLTTGVVAQLRGLSTDVTATERQLYTDMADVLEILLTGQIQARGEASRVERKPIVALDNFYVAGPPLRPGSGRLFAGRQDVFRKIEQLWRNPFQKQAVVLHGQRRMGKTSILYHLQEGLGTEYIPVMVDLQGQSVGWKAEADLWKTLSRRIERVLSRAGILSEPTDLASSPVSRQSFDVFLDSIEDVLGEQRYLVLMFDEFEMLERKIDAGIITVDFLDYLRHLIQHRRQILVVLAGHHTLEERMGKYWSPLMGVAQPIHVSYLDHRSAHQLITNPWDDFQLSYTQDAIARLEQATGRQPMLLQHACHIVINLVNERLKEIGGKLYPTATRADVDAALDRLTSRAFTYYFDAVWDWLDEEERDALVRLAQAAQKSPNGWVEYQDVRSVSQEVLERLVTREVLESRDDQCRFWIELLRQWVMKRDFETNV
ncbi:MAG: AAA family ATPase, partial [Anaerolineales bacterium]